MANGSRSEQIKALNLNEDEIRKRIESDPRIGRERIPFEYPDADSFRIVPEGARPLVNVLGDLGTGSVDTARDIGAYLARSEQFYSPFTPIPTERPSTFFEREGSARDRRAQGVTSYAPMPPPVGRSFSLPAGLEEVELLFPEGMAQRLSSGLYTPQDEATLYRLSSEIRQRLLDGGYFDQKDPTRSIEMSRLFTLYQELEKLKDLHQAESAKRQDQRRKDRTAFIKSQNDRMERDVKYQREESARISKADQTQAERIKTANLIAGMLPDLDLPPEVLNQGISSDYLPIIINLALARNKQQAQEEQLQAQRQNIPVFLPTVTTV